MPIYRSSSIYIYHVMATWGLFLSIKDRSLRLPCNLLVESGGNMPLCLIFVGTFSWR
jgi:hypothetical protein